MQININNIIVKHNYLLTWNYSNNREYSNIANYIDLIIICRCSFMNKNIKIFKRAIQYIKRIQNIRNILLIYLYIF